MKFVQWILMFVVLSACANNNTPTDSFRSDFENCKPGRLSDNETKQEWAGAKLLCGNKDYVFYKSRISNHPHFIEQEGSNSYLKVILPENKFGPVTGAQWRIPLLPADSYFLSYKIKFDNNFDFVKGGKLPGLAGGTANSGGKIPTGYDGWSARLMFWEEGKLSFYMYFPTQSSKWGERLYFTNLIGDTIKAQRGKWHTIKQYVKMNTPNKKDGIVQGWIDGEEVLFADTILFRKSTDLQIDQILYSVFMGGDDSSWAPKKDETIAFDDFIVKHPEK